MNMVTIWALIFVVMILLEVITPANLITIWFAFGAMFAFLSAYFNLPLPVQIISFALVSLASLLSLRPLMVKVMRGETSPTNADRFIGLQFRLDQDLIANKWYQQPINRDVWSIIAVSDKTIKAKTLVEVVSIDGVKLVVKPIKEED